jgi:hypothetical protein
VKRGPLALAGLKRPRVPVPGQPQPSQIGVGRKFGVNEDDIGACMTPLLPCGMDAASERIARYEDCGHNNHAGASREASRWSLG